MLQVVLELGSSEKTQDLHYVHHSQKRLHEILLLAYCIFLNSTNFITKSLFLKYKLLASDLSFRMQPTTVFLLEKCAN